MGGWGWGVTERTSLVLARKKEKQNKVENTIFVAFSPRICGVAGRDSVQMTLAPLVHKNFSGLLFLLPPCFPRWGNLAFLSIRKLASFWTLKKKADIRSSRPAAPRTAKKWSSGATPPATDREPRLARPNADGATARPRGGGGRDARGRGNRRWRRRGGEAAIRSAETRRRCGRGRLASASHRRPLRPRPPPTAR